MRENGRGAAPGQTADSGGSTPSGPGDGWLVPLVWLPRGRGPFVRRLAAIRRSVRRATDVGAELREPAHNFLVEAEASIAPVGLHYAGFPEHAKVFRDG